MARVLVLQPECNSLADFALAVSFVSEAGKHAVA